MRRGLGSVAGNGNSFYLFVYSYVREILLMIAMKFGISFIQQMCQIKAGHKSFAKKFDSPEITML